MKIDEKALAKKIGRNLTDLLISRGRTQQELADFIGVNKSTVSNWVNGARTPRMDKIDMMADFFNVDRFEILDDRNKSYGKYAVSVPVYARVAAGIPLEASEEIVDREEIPKKWTEFGDYYGIRIRGDSMQPRIEEGDVVIVRKQSTADDGQTVIAIVNGNDAVCKKLKVYKDGIALVSNNPMYAPMYFSTSDTQDIPVRIIGRVVEIRGKL